MKDRERKTEGGGGGRERARFEFTHIVHPYTNKGKLTEIIKYTHTH